MVGWYVVRVLCSASVEASTRMGQAYLIAYVPTHTITTSITSTHVLLSTEKTSPHVFCPFAGPTPADPPPQLSSPLLPPILDTSSSPPIPGHRLPRSRREFRAAMPSPRMVPGLHTCGSRRTSSPEIDMRSFRTPCYPFPFKMGPLAPAPCPAQKAASTSPCRRGRPWRTGTAFDAASALTSPRRWSSACYPCSGVR
jgi:hypothetical protein